MVWILRWCLVVWAVAQVVWLLVTGGMPDRPLHLVARGMDLRLSAALMAAELLRGLLLPVILVLSATIIWRCSRGTMPVRSLTRSSVPLQLIATTFVGLALLTVVGHMLMRLYGGERYAGIYPLFHMVGSLAPPIMAGAIAWLLGPWIEQPSAAGEDASAPPPLPIRFGMLETAALVAVAVGLVLVSVNRFFWLGIVGYTQFQSGGWLVEGPMAMMGELPVPLTIVRAAGMAAMISYIAVCIGSAIVLFHRRGDFVPLLRKLAAAPEVRALALLLLLKVPASVGTWIHEATARSVGQTTPFKPVVVPLQWLDAAVWALMLVFFALLVGRLARAALDAPRAAPAADRFTPPPAAAR